MKTIAMLMLTAMLAICVEPAHALTDYKRCMGGRAKAMAKYELCTAKFATKAYTRGWSSKDEIKLAKCREKLAAEWVKLQAYAGTPCDRPRFKDNGDGTVLDHLTGLVWEQKVVNSPTEPDYDNPHDINNFYDWSPLDGGGRENGTVYTDFLARLNAGEGFAGSNGWRLPTLAELLTVASTYNDCPNPTVECVVDPLFKASPQSWTATTFDDPFWGFPQAWIVQIGYSTQYVQLESKFRNAFARAVRGPVELN